MHLFLHFPAPFSNLVHCGSSGCCLPSFGACSNLTHSSRPAQYIVKIIGDSILPCRTRELSFLGVDIAFPIFTICSHSVMKDMNHWQVFVHSYSFNFCIVKLLFSLSNAPDRSQNPCDFFVLCIFHPVSLYFRESCHWGYFLSETVLAF